MGQLASDVEQASPAPPPGEGEEVIKGKSPWQLFWGRFKQDRAAFVGLGAIFIMVAIALSAPIIAGVTHDPNDVSHFRDMSDDFGLPKGPNSELKFYFGGDKIGRDVLSRTVYGVRLSLTVALVATLLSVAIGVVLGITAGFFGGWIDTLISRSVDIVLSIPVLLFALGIAAACSSTKTGCTIVGEYGIVPGPIALIIFAVLAAIGLSISRNISGLVPAVGFLVLRTVALLVNPFTITQGAGLVVFVIVLFSWPTIARIVRGNTLSLREKEFVEASRSLGSTNSQIMFREIFPNLVAPVLVYATLLIPSNIIFEASLSFLGVGLPQSTPSLGRILSEASDLFDAGAWWLMVFPGIFLVAMTLAFNLLGDGLRDALDPRTARL
jgi:peptide/nickel transport system permease protein